MQGNPHGIVLGSVQLVTLEQPGRTLAVHLLAASVKR
jgi:hypothetical protein